MKKMLLLAFVWITFCHGVVLFAEQEAVPHSADEVKPLSVGEKVPEALVRDEFGKQRSLSFFLENKPTILIFYRGGWCPYCNTHLGELQKIEGQLVKNGFQILAVSPDRPEKLRESRKKHELGYRLLSDSSMQLAKAMGLAFRLDDLTFKKYKESYHIDIEADSGETHHLLPVPAALIVDGKGVIRFLFAKANYKERISTELLLAEAEKVHQAELHRG
ncbi:MAG: AhpC/TSA family protein [Bdellovibrionales bacterium]|nr:AhpC/TSA family protein [Bdellovibrionales bacterium]